jgi:peptide deformylase
MNIIQPPLKIVMFPHPSLRHKARPLTHIDKKVQLIAGALLELMYEHRGLGLAAPQVGLPFQMFVANYEGNPQKRDLEGVFINPVIIEKKGGLVEAEEGCLSFPKLFQKVRRAKTVLVQAYNLKGELVARPHPASDQSQGGDQDKDNEEFLELSDLRARIWQHEIDHLHGDLFIDKLSTIGKLASRSTLREFERDYRRSQERGEVPPDPEIEKMLTALEALA